MKLGVVSDTHGSLSAWKETVKYLEDTDMILHAGDLLYHGARNPLPSGYDTEGLVKELNGFCGNLLAVKGNVDALVDDWVLPYPLSDYSVVIDNGRKIVIYHGYQHESKAERVEFAEQFGADILIYGHTHKPLLERIKGVILLNPGSAALPKQDPSQPTIAVIENTKIKIITLNDKEVIEELAL
ncbi:phosphodiesterase [Acetohalobium arabaticum]|uniref:Phosphoesterase n=1 Tax=Acetohalobium arabaticum (strain ATCC 49924 / DSM 5501 / Z-7288) TaxID=574087 RepID=D9QQP9_ACEAZ|nr:phosphodiesterase [Acetohalobium arabaticum]ADL12840.1 phosphodiesterase, MJ0936 family [Acetohalobium arabaticum DSM 5501]